MKITHIRTEYLENPIGIDIVSPRINWNLEDVKLQSAFEVEYDVNGEKFSTGIRISSSMHYDFEREFKSRDRVRFRIKALCDDEWIQSEEAFFEMGLLEEKDWKAQWI